MVSITKKSLVSIKSLESRADDRGVVAGEGEITRVEIGSVASSLVCIGASSISAEVGCTWGVGVAWSLGVACGKEVKSSDRS